MEIYERATEDSHTETNKINSFSINY
jgi:hypothetical protein